MSHATGPRAASNPAGEDAQVSGAEEGAALPLSQSPIWARMQAYYAQRGQAAWQYGQVPEYITSNPFIAAAYAEIVLAYWRDCADQDATDASAPRYVVELGAGTGRFAFHFLKRLYELQEAYAQTVPTFVYVMTDLAQVNVAAWRTNPRLKPFVDAGELDFAHFDATRDTALTLVESGRRLAPDTARGPGVVIANYLFDSIPADLYYVEGDALLERRVAVVETPQSTAAGRSSGEPDAVENPPYTLRPSHHPVSPDLLQEPLVGSILERHCAQLDAAVFSLPRAGMDMLTRLRAIFQAGLLCIVGDKGQMTWAGVQAAGRPEVTVPGLGLHDGAFSVALNFPALAHYAELAGGTALTCAHEPHRLGVAALLFGADSAPAHQGDTVPGQVSRSGEGWVATRRAYTERVADFGPDDFYVLIRDAETEARKWPVYKMLSLLRLSRWDPQLLADCLPALTSARADLLPTQRAELEMGFDRALAQDYVPTRRYDLAYASGRYYLLEGDHARALAHLQRAHENHSALNRPNAQLLYEVATCQIELGELDAAIVTLEQVCALAPNHPMAARLASWARQKRMKGE